jgi:hypothetical protein
MALPADCRALIERGDEPGPTDSGPIRKGEEIACTILWDGKDAKVVRGKAIRPMGSQTRQDGTFAASPAEPEELPLWFSGGKQGRSHAPQQAPD